MSHPVIIQGGMGVAVSNWRLARAVSRLGGLGVVSGTLLAVILARRLAEGDPGGELRRALAAFPVPVMAERVLEQHFIPGGKAPAAPFRGLAMPSHDGPAALTELTVVANFVEVFLAKEGHAGRVGLNLLEKIQLPALPSLYGAMLAGVDYIFMGAGIPRSIPGALDRLAAGEVAELSMDLTGAAPGANPVSRFDPKPFGAPALRRPCFFAIVSSATLALTLARKSNGRVDGFVVEGQPAGGHNAPPRGPLQLDANGEPVYGVRDTPDLAKIRELGLPFWLAGGYSNAEQLTAARALGAAGVQIGTAFAFCAESGIDEVLKVAAIRRSQAGASRVQTDPRASPTGFPFKVAQLRGTLSEPAAYAGRTRVCDLGYLREAYTRHDGTTGYRCSAEPVEEYVRKGGSAADTVGRKCLCNALAATVGLGQVRAGVPELGLVTAGTDLAILNRFAAGRETYTAEDVMRALEPR